jgi:c-di-GMP-binding flagellar brake protein YcgR
MQQPQGTPSKAAPDGDPLPISPVAAVDPLGAAEPVSLPRNTNRKDLPVESPGRMVLASKQSVFVTLHDISRGGCCVVRKGHFALQPEERVCIEMWREDIQTKISLSASVRWVRYHDGKTRAGLRFVDTSVKTHRLIDEYLQRSFRPGA